MGNFHICLGNDISSPTAPGNTCTTDPTHDTGFIVVDLPPGRYVFLDRRDYYADYIYLSAARAFQSPNLLRLGVAIIADYASEVGYEKENLSTNLEARTTRYDINPTIDASGTTTTAFNSCFRIATS